MTRDQQRTLSVGALASILAVVGTVAAGVYKVDDSIGTAIAQERERNEAAYADRADVAVLTAEVRELRRAVDRLAEQCSP